MADAEQLSARQVENDKDLADWRVLADGLSAWFGTSGDGASPSLTKGADLLRRVASLVDGDLPDVDLRADGIRIRLGVPEPGCDLATVAATDVALARSISAAARELGLTADSAGLQCLHLFFDTRDSAAVKPFWQTVLGYQHAGDLFDPLRRDPTICSQDQDEVRPMRNRIHLDVGRPADNLDEVKSALGSDGSGPYGLLFADPEGNEVDLVPGGGLADDPEVADWCAAFGAMAFYPTGSVDQAVSFAAAVADLADGTRIPLLIDLRPDGIMIDSGKDLWEDDGNGRGERFLQLARSVQQTARDHGLTADRARVRFVQFGLDAVDVEAVRSFWLSALGYRPDPREQVTDIFDSRRLGPVIIFQPMDETETDRRRQRNRIHVDLSVPGETLQQRIDAALTAGGRITFTDERGRWTTITDPEGNEVDISAVGRA